MGWVSRVWALAARALKRKRKRKEFLPCAEALVALGYACAQLKNAWAAIEKI